MSLRLRPWALGLAAMFRVATPAVTLVKKEGDEHVRAGRYADAERCYRRVIESEADHPGAMVGLGFVLRQLGRTDEAREVLELAVQLAADDADAHYLLATVLETPAARDPESVLQCRAIASCERALALNPRFLEAQQILSRLLIDTGQLERAAASYRREIELTPEYFGPHHQLGVVLMRLMRHAEAIESLQRAISLHPGSGASYSSLAAAYTDLDDSSEDCLALAQANFEHAVAAEPDNPDFHYNLGFSYWRGVQLDRAMASFDRAIELDDNHLRARWARVMLWAPAFSAKSGDPLPDRSGFGVELARFEARRASSETDNALFVGDLQPFFLAYQEECNLALLRQYGGVCARAMQRWLEREPAPAFARPRGDRIRLGVVSGDIRLHSVWMALIKGWLRSFDRARFEIVLFSLAAEMDAETSWARSRADVFLGAPKSLSEWVSAIREQNCDILLYPAIGLDPRALQLASLRLAAVQINSWGHPDTSGLPTVDYYLSADCFEPAAAQAHYSERLVLLPHFGNRIEALALPACDLDFAAMTIDRDRPILVCPGTPYKYQPAHDHVFVEVARSMPNAQLVFFRPKGSALARLLASRITQAFAAAGLDAADHVRFVRWLNFQEFHSLLRCADLMLDTIGFSGYNTAVQAIECGLPLVTREGRFLRGRLASGVLRRMDLPELITQTKAEYVNLAVRLISDRDYQARIRREIEQRRSVLFDDQSAIGPLQEFLASVARPRG